MLFRTECSLGFLKCFRRASLFAAIIIASALTITIPKAVFRVFVAVLKAASVTASVIVRAPIVVVG
jgi:cellulose synthase/poly-beta-1,6-N-acetylglucosamine synthase-like glycosyltransferase